VSTQVETGLTAAIRACAGTLPFRLAGAHDALTARLVEEAGFDGVWAGSLEITVSHGVPDTGELPLAEAVERVAEMTAAVRIPLLVDAENGGGDPARVVRELEAAGAAGIAIEDKAHPRFNSLVDAPHRLRDIGAFCDALQAALAERRSPAFAVVARVEALVAGEPCAAALARCEAYAEAGADAVILHSRSSDGADLLETLQGLRLGVPIGVIPTAYYRLSAARLRRAGASFAIYANHGVRAQVEAVRRVLRSIVESGSSEAVEPLIASVPEIMELGEDG
jgi:phosphoenolpyruvate phosphomutase